MGFFAFGYECLNVKVGHTLGVLLSDSLSVMMISFSDKEEISKIDWGCAILYGEAFGLTFPLLPSEDM